MSQYIKGKKNTPINMLFRKGEDKTDKTERTLIGCLTTIINPIWSDQVSDTYQGEKSWVKRYVQECDICKHVKMKSVLIMDYFNHCQSHKVFERIS